MGDAALERTFFMVATKNGVAGDSEAPGSTGESLINATTAAVALLAVLETISSTSVVPSSPSLLEPMQLAEALPVVVTITFSHCLLLTLLFIMFVMVSTGHLQGGGYGDTGVGVDHMLGTEILLTH